MRCDVAEVRVPRTPKRALGRTRRPSTLLLGQIEHLEWAVLPASQRKPDTPLDQLRRTMQEKGVRVAAVHSEDRYLGLVSIEDIGEAILVSAFVKNQATRRAAMG